MAYAQLLRNRLMASLSLQLQYLIFARQIKSVLGYVVAGNLESNILVMPMLVELVIKMQGNATSAGTHVNHA